MVKFLYLIYILIRELIENNKVRKSIHLRTCIKSLNSILIYIRKSSKTLFGRSYFYIYFYERFFYYGIKNEYKNQIIDNPSSVFY